VTDTATIIDLGAYRLHQQARRLRSSQLEQAGMPQQFTPMAAAFPMLWFWPAVVWLPVFVPAAAAEKRDLP
jgi:hypothetical protein